MVNVTFLPAGKIVSVKRGTKLHEAAEAAGISLQTACGGKGTCGKCKVKITSGDVGEATPAELKYISVTELAAGWVLACQRDVVGDVMVDVPQYKDAVSRKVGLSGTECYADGSSVIIKKMLVLEKPTIHDSRADLERLLAAIPGVAGDIDIKLIQSLPALLRDNKFIVTTVTRQNRLISVEAGDTSGCAYGLAVDIGTTTVVGWLMDLQSGLVLDAAAMTNPQQSFGADVISRITYAAKRPEHLERMQKSVIGALNRIVGEITERTGVNKDEIYEAVVVGNTTMSHLFLGVDPGNLAPAPFVPAYSNAVDVRAEHLGLEINPAGMVLVLPNIAGYVGSDTVGVMLATHLDEGDEYRLAIDIGTNGEIVLAGGGRMLTCSTAAGPAFEGAQIKCGMRAADGAVEAVKIVEDVSLTTIGGGAVKGICGSGLIDAVAALLSSGVVAPSGRLKREGEGGLADALVKRLHTGADGPEFILVDADLTAAGAAVTLTQKDIRELQLAKGAIHAGVKVLLREMGITLDDVSQVLLAGAFGNYINKESALAIGLLPDVPAAKVISVGNAAGDGARMALVSGREREKALKMAREAEHVELSARVDFQQEFIASLNFPTATQ